MIWRNDPTYFGAVSRGLHWSMALLILAMLALGTTLSTLQPGLSNLYLYGLHKTGGFVALALVVARLIWHRISPPPAPTGPPKRWTNRAARATHAATYILLVAIPLSGWIASSATGIDILFAERWTIPPIAPPSEAIDHWGFVAHGLLTKALMGLLALHVTGALTRGIKGDGTLRRMLGG